MTRDEREAQRILFRPPDGKLELLFIGESAPASGRFFYNADSGLYRAMRGTFQILDPSIPNEAFLQTFQAYGCYLVDLCPEPVDQMDPKSRKAACLVAEPLLATAIAQLRPRRIATLVRSIESNVTRAIRQSGWSGPVLHLPYPGRWIRHRKIFSEAVINEVRTWMPGR